VPGWYHGIIALPACETRFYDQEGSHGFNQWLAARWAFDTAFNPAILYAVVAQQSVGELYLALESYRGLKVLATDLHVYVLVAAGLSPNLGPPVRWKSGCLALEETGASESLIGAPLVLVFV